MVSGKSSSFTSETTEKKGFTGFEFDGNFPRTLIRPTILGLVFCQQILLVCLVSGKISHFSS